jgi:spore germination protein GerM
MYFGRPSRKKRTDVRSSRLPLLIALLAIISAGTWYAVSHRPAANAQTLAVYYTKVDGTHLGEMRVSLRPRQAGENDAEYLHDAVLYAAVEALAGPPSDVEAIRFPPGTRVLGVRVEGSTASIDLSKDVEQQAGGTFGENGEFKALVYTLTGVRGVDAVQISIEGSRLETLPGGNLELDQPLHRSDW